MNRGSSIFLALLLLAAPANADQIRSGDSVTITVSVTVVQPEDYGLDMQQLSEIGTVHSLAWNVKQCCLQDRHRLGMRADYCFDDEIQERLQYCSRYLNEGE